MFALYETVSDHLDVLLLDVFFGSDSVKTL